jgi:hypothetical protein
MVVDAKFGSMEGGWCSRVPIGPHGVGLWKNIRRGWRLFSSHTRFELGNGSRTSFWDDVWCGQWPLKEAFPVLYGIACDKDACVAAHLDFSSGSIQWDVSFSRAAHDWELDIVTSFFSVLYSIRVSATVYHIWSQRNESNMRTSLRSKERILNYIIWDVRARIMAKGRFKTTNENVEICCGWGLPDKNYLKIGELELLCLLELRFGYCIE